MIRMEVLRGKDYRLQINGGATPFASFLCRVILSGVRDAELAPRNSIQFTFINKKEKATSA